MAGRPPFFRPDPEKTFLSTVSRIRIRIEPGKVASGDRSLRSEDLPGGEADLARTGGSRGEADPLPSPRKRATTKERIANGDPGSGVDSTSLRNGAFPRSERRGDEKL